MKIALIATEFPPAVGGMEQHALGLADALSKFDEVTVYTHRRFQDHPYQERFPVKPVLEGDVYKDLEQLRGIRTDAWLCLNAGYAVLARFLPDPVFCYCHGNDFLNPWIKNTKWYMRRTTRTIKSIPFFWRFAEGIDRKVSRRAILDGLERANLVFVNSRFTKKRLQETFSRLDKEVVVKHPGIKNIFFDAPSANTRRRIAGGDFKIITAARLSSHAKKKNIAGVLLALARVSEHGKIQYDIFGDGDLRYELEKLSSDLGLSGKVKFLGSVNSQRIIAELDNADLFVLASKASDTDVESFGIVYVEAAARGVPVLMSAAGGATDAAIDGVTGRIIDDSDPNTIAEGIKQIWENYDDFDKSEIRKFAEQFRWDKIGAEMREIIRSRIGK